MQLSSSVKKPITGFAILLLIGPSIVWASEYIGSGEVILATRNGAIFGTGIIWVVASGIFLKFWIGMSGAQYTVRTGEGMIDMFARMPGPKNWAVWIVLVSQVVSGAVAMGGVASAAGVFLGSILPISHSLTGWIICLFSFLVAWVGRFNWLKVVMSLLVLLMVIGVLWVAAVVFPGWAEFLRGLYPAIPDVPGWAIEKGLNENPWDEILPLLGWAAGGFGSQVWYSYWVIGAGYGAAEKDVYGKPADIRRLKGFTREDVKRLKGWSKIVYYDSTFAIIIGLVITSGFIIAGAGVLGAEHLAPEGERVALQLSEIFSVKWGATGGFLFLLGGTAALTGTLVGQLSGWPRLLADAFRICIPVFNRKFKWIVQFRMFLVLFFLSNMIIVFHFNYRPVVIIKFAAILEGLMLTPFQAICILIGLYVVMPRMYQPEISKMLRPSWVLAVGLIIAFLVFGYFCIAQVPAVL